MTVAFGQVQPQADCHQRARGDQRRRQRLAADKAEQGAEERRHREVRAGAGRAELAQRDDEQGQADAVAERQRVAGPREPQLHAGSR